MTVKKWLIVLMLLLAGCAAPTDQSNYEQLDLKITRYYDSEAGVVCWIYDGYQGDGISCLPEQYTRLSVERE